MVELTASSFRNSLTGDLTASSSQNSLVGGEVTGSFQNPMTSGGEGASVVIPGRDLVGGNGEEAEEEGEGPNSLDLCDFHEGCYLPDRLPKDKRKPSNLLASKLSESAKRSSKTHRTGARLELCPHCDRRVSVKTLKRQEIVS